MGAPRVFVSMFGTLIVFSIAIYGLTGSLATALIETIASAIILQVGYFACIVFLSWKAAKMRRAADATGAPELQVDESGSGLPVPTLEQFGPLGR
jgi:exopolysaccharide production repressor protein